MANKKIMKIPICMAVSTYTVRDTIQQGDVDAYRLEITLTDIDQIDGRAELRFEFPDGQYSDRETTVVGNTVIYEMQPEDYSQLGDLRCLVRLMDDHLFTPVLLIFTGIRPLVGNVEFEGEIQPYPEWARKLKQQVDELAVSATRKFSQVIGNNSNTSFDITHNLETQEIVVQVYENASPYAQVLCDIELTTINQIKVSFGAAPKSNELKVVIVG